jgi:hypothetical protein
MVKKQVIQKNKKEGKKALAISAGFVAVVAAGLFLFGKDGKAHRAKLKGWAIKAKGEVVEGIESLKEVSKENYEKVVDKVIAKYKKSKKLTLSEVEKIERELKKHWKTIEQEVSPKIVAVKKVVKKTTKKPVSKKTAVKKKK